MDQRADWRFLRGFVDPSWCAGFGSKTFSDLDSEFLVNFSNENIGKYLNCRILSLKIMECS